MTYELTERERKVIEDLGWTIRSVIGYATEVCIEIENYSPAGEDLHEEIYVYKDDTLAEAARRWADDFDVDYHAHFFAMMLGKQGVPEHMETLVTDAKEIQQMMKDLALALAEAEAEDYGEIKTYRVPLVWQLCGSMYVEAKSRQEAIDYALRATTPLPDGGEYVDGSCEIDPDVPIVTM